MVALSRNQAAALGRGLRAVVERCNAEAAWVSVVVRVTARDTQDGPPAQAWLLEQVQAALKQLPVQVVVREVGGEVAFLEDRIARLEAQLQEARGLLAEAVTVQVAPTGRRWMSVAEAGRQLGVSQATISRAKADGRIAYQTISGGGARQPRYLVDMSTYKPKQRRHRRRGESDNPCLHTVTYG